MSAKQKVWIPEVIFLGSFRMQHQRLHEDLLMQEDAQGARENSHWRASLSMVSVFLLIIIVRSAAKHLRSIAPSRSTVACTTAKSLTNATSRGVARHFRK